MQNESGDVWSMSESELTPIIERLTQERDEAYLSGDSERVKNLDAKLNLYLSALVQSPARKPQTSAPADRLWHQCQDTKAQFRLEEWTKEQLFKAQYANIARALGEDNRRGVGRVTEVARKHGQDATLRGAIELLQDARVKTSDERMRFLEARARNRVREGAST